MDKFISGIKHQNVNVITVTQDLTGLRNISDDTAKGIVENCTVCIFLRGDDQQSEEGE